jgi:transcriptional antiterminator RfaH
VTHWYVIRTKPRQERRAEFHLRQFGIQTFLPLLKQRKAIRRISQMVIAPLFPGYFFAQFDIQKHYRIVSYARGVHKIVEFGLKPAEVNESMIETIKANLEDGYVTLKPERFRKGQIVYINGGPLTGLEAVFVQEMPAQKRVLLLLNTIGFQARLALDVEHICLPQAL